MTLDVREGAEAIQLRLKNKARIVERFWDAHEAHRSVLSSHCLTPAYRA
jgi:hypothetical protein